jgi:hypothetical protein
MPFPREAGGPGGHVPAIVVPTPNDKSISKIKNDFLIGTPFEFFIRTPFCRKSTLSASTQVRFVECDKWLGAMKLATSVWTGI